MNILYVSVHQILEYDEVRMLQSLGHTVFPLGAYFGFKRSQPFRPELSFGKAEARMMTIFQSSGCHYAYGSSPDDSALTEAFVDQFDVVIVMHSIDFITLHWDIISRRPVVWRTIGVNIEAEEERIAPFRARGCKIVRYSPMESLARAYAGHDAVIRFAKSPDEFGPWEGQAKQVLIFSNAIKKRFPTEYEQVAAALDGFPHVIGGDLNQDVNGSVGLVSFESQLELLRTSRIYLYGVGTFITYTLNFMEAWMSGIPVVVLDGRSFLPPDLFKFAEVTSLIQGGVDGMIVTSVAQARDVFALMLDDRELARSIGTNGRRSAIATFGMVPISRQWDDFLSSLTSDYTNARSNI
jgi:hypothetical protein